jgi:hypothetical protein
LTAAELTRAKLQTAPSVFASAAPEPVASPPAAAPVAVSSASTAAAVGVAAITDRGWLLHEKASRSTLTRRHPLTVEGEEIGTFDLVFACGATPDSYTATYREARRPGPRGASVALRDVSLTLGRETSALKVMMLETTAKPVELISSARGKVSAALVKSLAGGATRSLMVETATNRNEETAIRVGNTGLDQHFAKFAAACAR